MYITVLWNDATIHIIIRIQLDVEIMYKSLIKPSRTDLKKCFFPVQMQIESDKSGSIYFKTSIKVHIFQIRFFLLGKFRLRVKQWCHSLMKKFT